MPRGASMTPTPSSRRGALVGHQVRADDVRIVEKPARQFGGVQHLDHARPMIHQRAMERLASAHIEERAALGLGERRRHHVADLHPRQRPDAIPALVGAERLDVRELHIAPVFDILLQHALVRRVIDLIEDRPAVGVTGAKASVVEIERAAVVDETHHVGARRAEGLVEIGIGFVQLDDEPDRRLRPIDDLVDPGAHRIAIGDAERLVHSARNDPGAMDAFSGDMGDDFLPELAGEHALPGEIGEGRRDPNDVAFGDFALEAEQEIGRREMEEVQRVRLHQLAIMQEAAQLLRRRRQRAEAGDKVHRLGRRDEVADRADAAEALHRDRNLPVWPAPDEDLEPAELDDVEPDLMNLGFPRRGGSSPCRAPRRG